MFFGRNYIYQMSNPLLEINSLHKKLSSSSWYKFASLQNLIPDVSVINLEEMYVIDLKNINTYTI